MPHWSERSPHRVPAEAGLFGCSQCPRPSQTSVVHGFQSSGQRLPRGSKRHVEEQQSPSKTFPSSHSSPASRTPFPQRLPTSVTAPMRSQEPVTDRAIPDSENSTRQVTVVAGPEMVCARTLHLPLMSVEPKTGGAMLKRNASCKTSARTATSLTPESPAGQSSHGLNLRRSRAASSDPRLPS